jgi:hypothetical protein
MNTRLRETIEPLVFLAAVAAICVAIPFEAGAQAHTVECGQRSGIDRARCERHQKMAAQCGPLKGEAHFACDREFLLANPLVCPALAGADVQRCEAEGAAFKTCEPKPGGEFMRCVRDEIKASPMGH